MWKLAAFADEISPDIDVQIEQCVRHEVSFIELRSVAGKNVLDLDDPLRREIKRKLDDRGLSVISIGSPIGKVRIDEPFGPHFDRFKIAVDMADFFAAPLIRIFSYYPAEGASHDDLILRHRDEVLRRMQAKVDYMRGRTTVLVHENEANIYGEKALQCLDILTTINSPALRAAFDFANFVQAREDTWRAWEMLRPYVVHIHVKDALLSDGRVVPAGQGDGKIREILQDAARIHYHGVLSLEPHLAHAGQFQGYSGPELFKVAVDALRGILATLKPNSVSA
ncbi:MAG: sugar phosphate isomerase/epimerase [bacterium]|nr:sugar phosphate isomerase/epimerase [bacterium]